MEYLNERFADLRLSCEHCYNERASEKRSGWIRGIKAVREQLIEIGVEEAVINDYIRNCFFDLAKK